MALDHMQEAPLPPEVVALPDRIAPEWSEFYFQQLMADNSRPMQPDPTQN